MCTRRWGRILGCTELAAAASEAACEFTTELQNSCIGHGELGRDITGVIPATAAAHVSIHSEVSQGGLSMQRGSREK